MTGGEGTFMRMLVLSCWYSTNKEVGWLMAVLPSPLSLAESI